MFKSRNRFVNSNVSELQEINRRTIFGYQDIPLMSLEEAVESIVQFVPLVRNYADEAKQQCKRNTKLTVNESAAIYLYTKHIPIYEKLNKTLRDENPYALEPWFPYLKLLFTGIGKLPCRSTTVWRGVGEKIGSNFAGVGVHTWWSMNSCSSKLDVAGMFASEEGTLFCINTIHGRDITAYSAHTVEEEIVLMPGTSLRVKSTLVESNGRSIVHLNECCAIPEGKHVMLSYHSSSHDIVLKICQFLQEVNIPVWFDKRSDMSNMYNSLADGVENAEVVCCFITPDYGKTATCKLELQYAQKRYKRIIKCLLGHAKASQPCDWLELITTDPTHVDFDDVSELGIDSKAWELLGLIKTQPLASQHLILKSVDQPSYLFELIRYEYQQHSRLSRIMNPSRSFSIEQSYINLVIVETKEQQLKEKKLLDAKLNDEIIGTFEEIYGTKTDIEIKDIFQRCDHQTKNVLVLGRAGIGKTTFCQYVTYEWATGAIWQQYDLVILFHLRNLTDDLFPPLTDGTRYSLVDLVQTEYFHHGLSENDRKRLQEQLAKSQVLWLLDGYDEIVQNMPQHLQYLLAQLRRTSHHVVTSRPYLNTLSYKVQLEITGFTNDNIKEYVGKFFDQIKGDMGNALGEAQKLLGFLKCNPRVWGIVHIPVNLELICTLWCNTDWSETTAMTMTTVYDKMTEWLCRRHLEKQSISSSRMNKEDVYTHCHKELAFLESLAFHGIESNSIIIRPKLLQIASKESQCSLCHQLPLLNIGILKSLDYTPIGTSIETDKNHYFVHLSFQEHFAARYLIRALGGDETQKKKAIDFIKARKYDQRFELILTFASGLLNEGADQRRIKLFWDTLLGEPLDLIGLRHAQVVISCIEETGCNRSLPHFCEVINTVKKCISYFVFNKHNNISHPLAISLRRSPSLVNQSEILDVFKAFHKHIDPAMRTYVYLLIADLPIVKTHVDVIRLYLTALNDTNTEVRCGACFALSKMGEKAATSEVIKRLLDALGDRNNSVRASACEALGAMGEKAAISKVIDSLGDALKNEDSSVRSSACKALGALGGKTATHEVVNRLMNTFKDENYFVRTNASEAIGEIARKTSTNEIINTLVHALGSIDDFIKSTALETLVKMGEKELKNEVINRFMSALGDPEPSIRKGVCEVLGIMGEKVGTIEVVNGIAKALTDKDSEVRRQACVALGEIGEKAATDQVINILVTTLMDTDLSVRDSAAKVLIKMSREGKNIEVIDELVIVLRNKDSEVRRQVCITLSWMTETATIDEVINSLLSAVMDTKNSICNTIYEYICSTTEKEGLSDVVYRLSSALVDTDWLVRDDAREALGMMSKTGENIDVVDGLVSALRNQDSEIRRQACIVLGEMSEKVATSLVINSLLIALADAEYFIRRAACEALGMLGQKAVNINVVKGIMSLLTDKDPGVRRQACVTLGKMGETITNDQVIIGLTNALMDTHSFVRASACKALRKMGKKATSLEVINGLAGALKDETSQVRYEACVALGAMGGKVAADEVVNNLLIAAADENCSVKESACIVLRIIRKKITTVEKVNKIERVLRDEYLQTGLYRKRRFRGKAKSIETDEVVNNLASAVVHTESFVKDSACAVLCKMSKNVATNVVLCGLFGALVGKNRLVGANKSPVFDNIGEKGKNTSIIRRLLSALVSTDRLVRDTASDAVNNTGEKGKKFQVILGLVDALANRDAEVRRQACVALGGIKDEVLVDLGISSFVIDGLMAAFTDDEFSVIDSACEALSKMGKNAATNVVTNGLVSALSNRNYCVRSGACEALGMMGEKAADLEVINALISAIEDRDPKIRHQACIALGKIGEKAATGQVVNGLMSALGDVEYCVRRDACEALGMTGRKVANPKIINGIVSALKDNNSEIRRHACGALSKMGEKAATDQVVNGLMSALGDVECCVRSGACEALGMMGEKAVNLEVINGLVNAVGDEDPRVRHQACIALGKISENAGTDIVTHSFVSALCGAEDFVRRSACEALGLTDRKVANPEIINGLVSALRDKDSEIRRRACAVLGMMGEKVATYIVIHDLMSALRDVEDCVRRGACEALGMLGEKAVDLKVIDELVGALRDKNSEVRHRTYRTLDKMGGKAAADLVISILVTVLGDVMVSVRRDACETLGMISKKEGTMTVINRLASALLHVEHSVGSSTCEAVDKIGERTGANEVIKGLVRAVRNVNEDVRRAACEVLESISKKGGIDELIGVLLDACCDDEYGMYEATETITKILDRSSRLSDLKPNTVCKLSEKIKKSSWWFLRNVCSEKLIKTFFDSEIYFWLPIIKTSLIRSGYGLTVCENTVAIYGSAEPVEILFTNGELGRQMKDYLVHGMEDSPEHVDEVEYDTMDNESAGLSDASD